MALFPPWLYYDGSTSNQRSAGYHFLLNRPVAGTYEEMFGFDDDMTTEFVRVRLNGIRLTLQILTLWFLAAGGSLLSGGRRWSGGCLLTQGLLGILLLIALILTGKF